LLALAALAACGTRAKAPSAATPQSGPVLYDRIGRMDAIKLIVRDFVEEQLLRGPLAPHFTNVNAAMFQDSMATQLCELTGGPCKYTGRSMRDAHATMSLTHADFTAFTAALQQTLAKHQVKATEQEELLALVELTRSDVVAPQ
jgi:hemoglobin